MGTINIFLGIFKNFTRIKKHKLTITVLKIKDIPEFLPEKFNTLSYLILDIV
jgi:hypothetical protein